MMRTGTQTGKKSTNRFIVLLRSVLSSSALKHATASLKHSPSLSQRSLSQHHYFVSQRQHAVVQHNILRACLVAMMVCMLCVLSTAGSYALTVTRDAPSQAVEQTELSIQFAMTDAVIGEQIVIDERLPAGVAVQDWNADGAIGKMIARGENSVTWELTASSRSPTLTYAVLMPKAGVAQFSAVWAASGGDHGHLVSSMRSVDIPATSTVRGLIAVPVMTTQRSQLLVWLLLAIFATSVGLVIAVETSSRHTEPQPFGQRTKSFLRFQCANIAASWRAFNIRERLSVLAPSSWFALSQSSSPLRADDGEELPISEPSMAATSEESPSLQLVRNHDVWASSLFK